MSKLQMREGISTAIAEEMRRDEKIFVMGEDVAIVGGVHKATKGLLAEFGPQRVRNTPLSEAAIVSAAVGAALAGARPIAEIMHIDFFGCCMDSICNQMATMHYKSGGKLTVPMVLRTQSGRGRGNGCTQSQSLDAWVTHIPGLKVIMPSNAYDAKGLLKSAIRSNDPVVFIEHKGLYHLRCEVPDEEYLIPLGKADVKREGSDVTIIGYSKTVHTALEAAELAAKEGISVEVIDLRTLIPLDMETIAQSVKKTGRVIVTHEASECGGFGAEIASRIGFELFDWLDGPVTRVCGSNTPVPFAPVPEIESAPTAERLLKAIRGMI